LKGGFVYPDLDSRWSAEVLLVAGGPAATLAVKTGILDDHPHPVKLLPDHDLAQVVLLMAAVAAFAFMDIFAHVFPP
jgi:hypothetical protein